MHGSRDVMGLAPEMPEMPEMQNDSRLSAGMWLRRFINLGYSFESDRCDLILSLWVERLAQRSTIPSPDFQGPISNVTDMTSKT